MTLDPSKLQHGKYYFVIPKTSNSFTKDISIARYFKNNGLVCFLFHGTVYHSPVYEWEIIEEVMMPFTPGFYWHRTKGLNNWTIAWFNSPAGDDHVEFGDMVPTPDKYKQKVTP